MNTEQLHILPIKQVNGVLSVHEHHSPLEGREPERRVLVRLVLADEDRMRHRQQTDHSGGLDEG